MLMQRGVPQLFTYQPPSPLGAPTSELPPPCCPPAPRLQPRPAQSGPSTSTANTAQVLSLRLFALHSNQAIQRIEPLLKRRVIVPGDAVQLVDTVQREVLHVTVCSRVAKVSASDRPSSSNTCLVAHSQLCESVFEVLCVGLAKFPGEGVGVVLEGAGEGVGGDLEDRVRGSEQVAAKNKPGGVRVRTRRSHTG